jgi:imidazolonepropionase-like amidohydrolase
VLIEDGVVRAVEARGVLERAGHQTLDAAGRHLVPALADMHVHWWDAADWPLFVAAGVTTVRNMAGAPLHLELDERVRRGELPGPRVVTASPVVDGVGEDGESIWPGAQLLVHPARARALVDGYARQGYRQVKAYSWLRLDVLEALGQAAAGAGLPLVGHCPEGVTFEEAMTAGMRCFEHLLGIERGHLPPGVRLDLRRRPARSPAELRRLLAAVPRVDLDAVRRLAAAMAAAGVWNCPTLVLTTSARDPDAALADPRLALEGAATAASWEWAARSAGPLLRRVQVARSELLLRVVSILREEGAPLLAGTDSPNPYVFQGSSIHDELANLRLAGLTPAEALRAATTEAARFLGEADAWGAVAPGGRADLLLVAGSPLEDLAVLRDPDVVLVNGFRLSRADLRSLVAVRGPSPPAGEEAEGRRGGPV